jgi:hypothetical protein
MCRPMRNRLIQRMVIPPKKKSCFLFFFFVNLCVRTRKFCIFTVR